MKPKKQKGANILTNNVGELLNADATEESQQRLLEYLVDLIQEVNRQAIQRDLATAWEEIKNARESGDEQARAIAAAKYEELLLERANPSFVKTRVAEMVLREVTSAVIEAVRMQFHQTGKGDLLLEIEASMSDQLRLIFDWMYEQSTLDPFADQSSSMVS